MNSSFWARMHGGATHFPIAFVLGSVLFDFLALAVRNETRRRDFRAIGFWLIVSGALLSFGAIISGLALSKGVLLGNGLMARHHAFVWPAFGLLQVLAVWRLVVGSNASRRSFALYLAAAAVAAILIATAGYWGGEMSLAS